MKAKIKDYTIVTTMLTALLIIQLPFIKYYLSPDDSCMKAYIDSGSKTATIYRLEDGECHIEKLGGLYFHSGKKIGQADGCMIFSQRGPILDGLDTQYCFITKILKAK